MDKLADLIEGIDACVALDGEYSRYDYLSGIESGQYHPIRLGESFVLVEVCEDAHFKERVLYIVIAWSPPSYKGFLASIAKEIKSYADAHGCKRVLFRTHERGYQALIDAGKTTPGIKLTPYLWHYEVEIDDD